MFCPKCGKNIEDNARFCPSCGASVSASVTPKIAKPKIPTLGWVAVIVICVLLTIIIVNAIKSNDSTSVNQSENKEQITSSSEEVVVKSAEELIVGKWAVADDKSVSLYFTADGKVKAGAGKGTQVVFGGDVFNYELLDDETLYFTGGSLKVGVSVPCIIEEDTLTLYIDGHYVELTKVK